MYSSATINQELCIYILNLTACLCAHLSVWCLLSSLAPQVAEILINLRGFSALLTGLFNICKTVDMQNALLAVAAASLLPASILMYLCEWLFQTHQNKISASTKHSLKRYVKNGKKPHSCWAYVSFNSLIRAARRAKWRVHRGSQGAFRSFGRNTFLGK